MVSAVLLMPFLLSALAADPVAPDLRKGWEQIQAAHTLATVEMLTRPAFGGRFTGEAGYTAAATWAASQFETWGLKPVLSGNSYLQAFPAPHSVVDEASLNVIIKGKAQRAELLKDYLPLLFADTGHAKGGVVFVGWGIHAPELGYDDYAGVDVRGKFVLCFRGTPSWDEKWEHHDEHRTRMAAAQSLGALGVVYILPELLAHPNGDLIPGFRPAMISETLANELLEEKGETATSLKARLRSTRRPVSLELSSALDLTVKARHFRDALGYNMMGYIEGTDPALKTECIVLGGHLDGVGEHMGIFFPGAEDNASGSAVVMELARAFASNVRLPRRSVLFVLFGGEEQGLKGATFFVDHLPAPCTLVSAMLNFDMVGVGSKVSISHASTLEDTMPLLKHADAELGIVAQTQANDHPGVRGGDFAAFHAKGYPFAAFETNGPRAAFSYHQPGDRLSTLRADLMANIARLAYRYAFSLADR